jgi:hypothetical protein
MMTLEIPSPGHARPEVQSKPIASRNLVVVASEPPRASDGSGSGRGGTDGRRSQPPSAGPNGLRCTRVAAHVVGSSAASCRRLSRRASVSPRFSEPIGCEPGRGSDLPEGLSEVQAMLEQAGGPYDDCEPIAEAVVALQTADVVIVGPLSPEDANAPALLPHLANLAGRAYRALRPPRELIVHPAFGQVARRFHFIHMSYQQALALGAGARDIGILAQRLRQLQGEPGEFAITDFSGHGLLWADGAWWEIEPISGADESIAGAVFCMAWAVARRFRRMSAAQALAYARDAAAATVQPVRRTRAPRPCD